MNWESKHEKSSEEKFPGKNKQSLELMHQSGVFDSCCRLFYKLRVPAKC